MDNSSTSVLPEEQEVSSLYHKAATLGVWIVAVQFVSGLLLKPIVRQLTKEGIHWVYYTNGIVNSALFLICTACGIMALAGMIKHGRARLLWKGIVCLLPAVGFLLAVLIARK